MAVITGQDSQDMKVFVITLLQGNFLGSQKNSMSPFQGSIQRHKHLTLGPTHSLQVPLSVNTMTPRTKLIAREVWGDPLKPYLKRTREGEDMQSKEGLAGQGHS